MSKAQQIVDEVCDKVGQYETNMSSFLTNVDEWGDLVRVRRPSRKNNTFSNPRLTEMFRAANTLSTTVYRMLTAQDPFFDTVPMTLVDMDNQDRLMTIQGTLETQLQESSYRPRLLQSIMSGITFGTTIVQEDPVILGLNALGRRIPVTTFTPRSMLQVAYDTNCTDLEDADWLSTIDLISDKGVMSLAKQPEYNAKAVEEASKRETSAKDIAPSILQRLQKYGYYTGGKMSRKEILCYYGKLDCLDDQVDYIVEVVNRKDMVKFVPNSNQWGKRNFRTAVWINDPMCIEPRGWGLGDIVGSLHKSMDANRQKVQDNITMAAYNMYEIKRSAGIDRDDLKIRPLQLIDTDEANGLSPVQVNTAGAQQGLVLEDILRQEFRTATGATDSLQAIITNATASEVSLAQNEAMRMISVRAEMMGEPLVRQHLNIMHSNNARFVKSKFTINRYLGPQMVYPKDLKCDVDFRLKMTTDKDYKPKRIETLAQVLQIITSTKSMHPELPTYSVAPIIEELLRALNVPVKRLKIEPQQQQMPPQGTPEQVVPMGPGGQSEFANTPVGPTQVSQGV